MKLSGKRTFAQFLLNSFALINNHHQQNYSIPIQYLLENQSVEEVLRKCPLDSVRDVHLFDFLGVLKMCVHIFRIQEKAGGIDGCICVSIRYTSFLL